MSLNIKNLTARLFRRLVAKGVSTSWPRRAQLGLTALESRDVPTALTVSSLGDLTEGGSAGGFRVTRDGDTAQALYVLVAPSGTATAGADYTGLAAYPSYLPIPAGASYADITLTPVDDAGVEGTETITVSAAVYSVMGPGPWSSTTINLFDNDNDNSPGPTVTVAKIADATEGGASGVVRFTRDRALFSTLTVNYAVSGTASPTEDYGPLGGSVSFAIGVSSVDVTLVPVADGADEGDETVLFVVAGGFGYAPGAAPDDRATVIIHEPSGSITAVRPDGSEAEEGWVAENNDNDNYNFYGDPDTSLDQIEDKDELDAVAGEDDLVPIHLSPIANAVSGDATWLSFASPNIRLWMNADKSGGQITSGMTEFDAAQAHTVYAEGLGLSSAVNAEVVNLEWSSGANPRRIIDKLPLTVFQIRGTQNVPGYSRHTYSVTVPGQVAATFGAITGGTQHSVVASKLVEGGAATNNGLIVNWGEGEVVGTYKVNVPGGFSATRQVNVVKVKLDAAADSNSLQLSDENQAQRPDKRGVNSSTDDNAPAMYASIEADRVAGPLVGGVRRGGRFIDMGFMQTVTVTSLNGSYATNGPVGQSFNMVANIEGKSYIDSAPPTMGNKPWVYKDYGQVYRRSYRIAGENVTTSLKFDMADSPNLPAVKNMTEGGVKVDYFSIVLDFVSYFVVHTKESVNSADASYTIRASVPWTWVGSGGVDATGAWTSAVPPGQSLFSPGVHTKMTESMNGDIVSLTLIGNGPADDTFGTLAWARNPPAP